MGQLVVLSGGLDSTVCMDLAVRESGAPPLALIFDYGQRHRYELDPAAGVAGHYRAEHLVVTIDTSTSGGSALTDPSIEVPADGGDTGGIPVTYVPARNSIFLAVALGVAEARGLDAVWIGVNAIDHSGYPDCRPASARVRRGRRGRPGAAVTDAPPDMAGHPAVVSDRPVDILTTEVFSAIQGEAALVGERQIFVRLTGCSIRCLTGCNIRCAYCDQPEALERRPGPCRIERIPGRRDWAVVDSPLPIAVPVDAVCDLWRRLPHHSVSLTGGEPLMQSGPVANSPNSWHRRAWG